MRIGIDARAAADEPGGRGRYVRELLRELAAVGAEHRFVLYARRRWDAPALDARFRWSLIAAGDPAWHVRAALRANREADVYLSTNSYLTPWFLTIPSVTVVYDMITFDRALRPQRRAALIERATLPLCLRRTAALAAISEATRRDLVARFPRAAPLARVIPLAGDRGAGEGAPVADVRRRYGLDKPYVLTSGTLEPRKNLARLVEAWSGLPGALRDSHDLVLVGATGWESADVLRSVRATARTLGYVPDGDLSALYRGADVVAYPSLYEGFGLPVLEALQHGTAVLTSNRSSLPEVAGAAALYVDPLDVADIRAGLERLLSDRALRDALASRGPARAALFSWGRTARATLDLLEETAG